MLEVDGPELQDRMVDAVIGLDIALAQVARLP